ncbi:MULTISPECIES: acetyl-CoA C-acyltransferase [unclassified Beijerinckia]|uniref:acetyl-CoA C-acyltransferase n=1 Tax=unclassified Beijerinckia TaxID=2638183 RepID=UPI00089624C4|nr:MULTISPECIES: acetyl-CoA C-acyltransferase [unclassified Beijerinckia]MDH7796303.1 acetyl-CoA C-acetyltransferase [Beijerinckia sp. GAS462]SEC39148.1 acetyl-CoA C-acetyltransferase/acetyl-CoA acyltransferase [Beijerinckia sp. 28-YEA-48]
MDAFIYDALRTPRGKARPDGGLAAIAPHELVKQLVDGLEVRVPGARQSTEALLLGCVGQIGAQGGNIALISKLHAGLPDGASAQVINNYCVSGLSAIGQAAAFVAAGATPVAMAGGVECMSRVTFMADRADYYTDMNFPARTRYVPVALAADRLAAAENISRADLDAAALRSNQLAGAGEGDPALIKSRIVVKDAQGAAVLARDECVRPQTTLESLAAMQPAFGPVADAYRAALEGEVLDHRHTIAHAPPMCDAAALALVAGRDAFDATPRARVVAWADAGGDPHVSLLAGFAAMDKALARAKLSLKDMDRIEFMEAFGVTIVKFLRDYDVDPDKVNIAGGHMSRGHPLGASGAILLSSLLDNLDAAKGRYGLVVTTGASGVGSAMVVERLT